MKTQILRTGIILLSLAFTSCENQVAGSAPAVVIEEGDQILIEDQTGKKWDITHAVQEYGFRAANFRHGLGPYAITPIGDPEFLEPGNKGYPAAHASILVIGVSLGEETRAYGLDQLYAHEIVNDKFGDTHVSVGY